MHISVYHPVHIPVFHLRNSSIQDTELSLQGCISDHHANVCTTCANLTLRRDVTEWHSMDE